jgi:hypothetical protein
MWRKKKKKKKAKLKVLENSSFLAKAGWGGGGF